MGAERITSNRRRKPSDSDRDVPSCVVTYPYPAKNIAIIVPWGYVPMSYVWARKEEEKNAVKKRVKKKAVKKRGGGSE